jgi:uncharacterized protein involved in exopolysaccharide biosynthesis
VRLTVKAGDRERVARIANRWADIFVQHVNELYKPTVQDKAFFESQLTEAREALTKAEQDLIDFQARNEAAVLNAQLNSRQASMNEYLSAARSLRLIVQDARLLQERLRSQDQVGQVLLSDALAALFLQVGAQNTGEPSIQLQISDQRSLTDKTVEEQIVFLNSLIKAMEGKLAALEQQATSLEPAILGLQGKLQAIYTESDRLSTARDVAKETYMTLSRKVAEAQIEAEDTTRDVRLASYAVAPDKPVSPRKMLNTAVGGALGLCVAVLGAFVFEYWRKAEPERE